MNPYEKTAAEMKRQSEGPKQFAKTAIGLGAAAGAAAFSPLLARAAPFLSNYIPQDLAIKGLSKIHPKFGEFVKTAMESGYDFPEVKDFLGEQVKESQAEPAKQEKNVIEQYSPDLFQYIQDLIQKGRSPLEAGALARTVLGQKYKNIISKMEKDHKADWSSIIQTVFGGSGSAPQQQEPQQQSVGGQGLDPSVAQILQQGNELLKRFRGTQ